MSAHLGAELDRVDRRAKEVTSVEDVDDQRGSPLLAAAMHGGGGGGGVPRAQLSLSSTSTPPRKLRISDRMSAETIDEDEELDMQFRGGGGSGGMSSGDKRGGKRGAKNKMGALEHKLLSVVAAANSRRRMILSQQMSTAASQVTQQGGAAAVPPLLLGCIRGLRRAGAAA